MHAAASTDRPTGHHLRCSLPSSLRSLSLAQWSGPCDLIQDGGGGGCRSADPVAEDGHHSKITVKVFRDQSFPRDFLNPLAYSVGAVALALIVGIPAGYAAARFSFSGKRFLMLVILATSMVPGVALLVPTYYLLDTVGLLNSGVVVTIILAARIIPQTVWFIANFVEAVPIEIEESAFIDGANRFQIVWNLILPLIRPGIAAVATIGIVTTWNDYITVAVFAPDVAKRTLQVALVNQVFDAIGISWSYMMAFVIIASMPIILMFGLVQKWFIAGLTAGAVKG